MGDICTEKAFLAKCTRCIALCCVLVMLSSCQQQRDEDVVAYINDFEITEAHLESVIKKYYYKSGRSLPLNYINKKAILESEFETYVLAQHAVDKGYDGDQASTRQLGIIERKVLAEEFLEQNILNGIYISDDDLREIFLRFNTTLRASHLFASDKATADSLYKLLQNGKNFEELAAEIFQNPYLKENGGDLGEFETDEMDIAFEDAAHLLEVGEYSKPVKTSQGYSIVKLTDRYVRPLITESEYANQKANLTRFVRMRKRELLTRSHIEAVTGNFEMDQEQIDKLWKWISSNRDIFEGNSVELLNVKSTDKSPLIELEGFEFSEADFFEETYFTPGITKASIRTSYQFQEYIKGLAFRTFNVINAKEQGIDEQEFVRGSIDYTYHNYLMNRVIDDLRASIEISDEEIREKLLEDNDNYVTPIQVNLSRIVVDNEELASSIVQALQNGADFNQLFRKHTLKIEDRATSGQLGYMPLTQLGTLAPKLNKLAIGEVSQPIEYQSNEYHIYVCNDRVESRSLSFEEARERIEPLIRSRKLEDLVDSTVEEVKVQHGAFIDEEAIKELVLNL